LSFPHKARLPDDRPTIQHERYRISYRELWIRGWFSCTVWIP